MAAVGLAGVKSPNTVVAFVSVERLLVGLPAMILWKPSNSTGLIICASFLWIIITLPIAVLLVFYVQVYLHRCTFW
jgi:hypothetical protein